MYCDMLLHVISIHAPRTGSDPGSSPIIRIIYYFNPRSPHGERRNRTVDFSGLMEFQSTLPARGATLFPPATPRWQAISIHAPRTGSDCSSVMASYSDLSFQSTLPARGATAAAAACLSWTLYFNPRSPHGERRLAIRRAFSRSYFNPRSPHGERRSRRWRQKQPHGKFQSTLPARGATRRFTSSQRTRRISIHAPRTGSDQDVRGV